MAPRAMSASWASRLCWGVALLLLAVRPLRLGAVRVGEFATGTSLVSAGAEGEAVAAIAGGRGAPESRDKVQHELDLGRAHHFVDAINPGMSLRLGEIREILDRFESIRTRVLEIRDPRSRKAVRDILRGIREKTQVLEPAAERLRALGEKDDGGDESPMRRDTICNQDNARFTGTFRDLLYYFCTALATTRSSLSAGEFDESAAFGVAGALSAMAARPEYHTGNVGWVVECVLGEEKRWVAKHLVQQSAADGEPAKDGGSENRTEHPLGWALRGWKSGAFGQLGTGGTFQANKSLSECFMAIDRASVEAHANRSLASVGMSLRRLECAKAALVSHVRVAPANFRDRVRDALQRIQERRGALEALAEEKAAAGEVDTNGQALPSERETICRGIEHAGIKPGLFEEMKAVCEAFDQLHVMVMAGQSRSTMMFEVLGRLSALRRRPGYLDPDAASTVDLSSEVDLLFEDEWYWLGKMEGRAPEGSARPPGASA
mmetsp:Transcript_77832/g.225042  ORF Transcript_77832/g.225042 Transcript_77832/m.225042 type:complete len:491 (+) Transcript_77832:94-1566(+)|eukprot:CAMPEP_0170267630 /NCGR_PEP_ID=MMETSP0116_2-20130129/33741_1 /TAXON_ID=400756 /ORGANISM="Durinskia baltica, Strain CSIRO CS-38" /LENGTH=490 /DNA_ID=CAMNT_0010518785 /DNA_START=34 /DNA_END=1506 /DNA_ORIENTATION=-